jgi:transcriptional regulator with PAS, ATPase and Fis domain
MPQPITHTIIGSSPAMQAAVRRLEQVAPTDLTVLITGESGTGKEVFAKAIHDGSPRKRQRMVSVNCGAIPENLLEAELFGNEKGAYTGAVEQRKGFFEVADKGTMFLDELGEMPLATQVKLLRVLETGEFSRLGSSAVLRVNVRVIAATNRTLEEEVALGTFRRDLYYRLNAVQIRLPALREHNEDIPMLVDFFATRTATALGMDYHGADDDAIRVLMRLPWHGNVRELRNMVETLVTLERGARITAAMLAAYLPTHLPTNLPTHLPTHLPANSPTNLPAQSAPARLAAPVVMRALPQSVENDTRVDVTPLDARFDDAEIVHPTEVYTLHPDGSSTQALVHVPPERSSERSSERFGERMNERIGERLNERIGERIGDKNPEAVVLAERELMYKAIVDVAHELSALRAEIADLRGMVLHERGERHRHDEDNTPNTSQRASSTSTNADSLAENSLAENSLVENSLAENSLAAADQFSLRLESMEQRLIVTALERFAGNRRMAAEALGVSERTLYRKLHEYHLLERFPS